MPYTVRDSSGRPIGTVTTPQENAIGIVVAGMAIVVLAVGLGIATVFGGIRDSVRALAAKRVLASLSVGSVRDLEMISGDKVRFSVEVSYGRDPTGIAEYVSFGSFVELVFSGCSGNDMTAEETLVFKGWGDPFNGYLFKGQNTQEVHHVDKAIAPAYRSDSNMNYLLADNSPFYASDLIQHCTSIYVTPIIEVRAGARGKPVGVQRGATISWKPN